MLKETIFLAGLLHDIGKFTERSKSYPVDEKFKRVNTGHPKYSAQLLETLSKRNPLFKSCSDELVELVLYHHEPRNDFEKIIQLADWLSSSEREKGETKEKYFTVPLTPIFSRLFDGLDKKFGYSLVPLSISEGFPKENISLSTDQYKNLVDAFLKEVSAVHNTTQLYYLLEKYLWCVPAQTTNYVSDISLFDHAKTTAAIALCLYEEFSAGRLTSEGLNKMTDNTDNHFMLIKGDVSGIQNFIFHIPSKGAAKSLKGHSVYVSLLSDVITRHLVRGMGLEDANILYNGGGNFYILAPRTCETKFKELRKKISRLLLEIHGGAIYVALDYILLSPKDMTEFNTHWNKITQKVDVLKKRKWKEIDLKENYESIFGPFGVGSKDRAYCQLCGVESTERKIVINPENEKSYCTFCASFIDLTNELKDADCLVIKEVDVWDKAGIRNYQDMFRTLGFEYHFTKKRHLKDGDKPYAYLINDTDFLAQGFQGYVMGSYQLPYDAEKNQQLSFNEIAQKSQGDKKIALLKLDVDNLGNIFSKGLGKSSTVSRVTSLSRMLALYFEGYINHLIHEKGWQDFLYVVFSGGDDTFIVGAWDKVLDFAKEFYDKFREFTCYHPQVTFSAGISIFREDFPVIMSSRITEEALEKAKNYSEDSSESPKKNKISLFGEVFNWTEFDAVKSFKCLLIDIITKHSQERNGDTIGRAFLYKIWKSTLGFKRILEESACGKVDNIRFWRLAYYLREVARDDADTLIREYRRIVLDNLLGKSSDEKVKNIMVVPAAVKWAQMETRKARGN
ncbi:type III-A CRISPR-associated protein Cas10/Csm1 [Tepidanaerobacter sp. GT38]|uniref:type III-A CRISPR-associated protein Cas10/Csm1 n=1 Tax=Tepidanaerobacter sp. GT38 TaxID=2722793 RepID=UPI001F031450|nr:type III-A CRISPR-associated protein Cas10/Csm1 [Tepidanaerobacter sp. GT38]MCG1013083.1 type III-A CRISPR-associated protein Cas10/Csm1 [Tepidanaerobacter sp. GT38]